MTARAIWLQTHVWLGIACGLVFTLLGLTGSALVYQDEILGALYPQSMRVEAPAQIAPPSRVVAAVAGQGRVTLIRHPERTDRPLQVSVESDGSTRILLVDPGTAALIGPMPSGFFPAMFDLHSALMLGPAGKSAVGWLGVVFIVSAVSGIVLWWPRGRAWRRALSVAWTAGVRRVSLDLHKVSGALMAIPFIVLSLTGSALVFREPLLPVMMALGGIQPPKPEAMPPSGPSLDAMVEEARRLLPGGRVVFVIPPRREGAPTRIRIRLPGEMHQNGRSYVLFDGAGKVIELQRSPDLPVANKAFDQWPYPLHTGYAGGEAGRLLVFVSGIVPAGLFGTGLYLWLRKRRKRRAAEAA